MIRNSTWKYDRKKLTIKINTDFEKWKLIYQMNIISVVFIRMFEDKIFCLNGWMFRGVLDKIIKIVYKINYFVTKKQPSILRNKTFSNQYLIHRTYHMYMKIIFFIEICINNLLRFPNPLFLYKRRNTFYSI